MCVWWCVRACVRCVRECVYSVGVTKSTYQNPLIIFYKDNKHSFLTGDFLERKTCLQLNVFVYTSNKTSANLYFFHQ